jgi:hypothetical protein
VGFEPTIAVLRRAKTVRALDRSATAIGCYDYMNNINVMHKVTVIILLSLINYNISAGRHVTESVND